MRSIRLPATLLATALIALACSPPTITAAPSGSSVLSATSAPTVAGVGQQLAFVEDVPGVGSAIYLADATTGAVTKLAAGDAPNWSPDGSRLAFSRSEGAGTGIWLMDDVGADQTRIGAGFGPTWSPDGTWIAFARSDGDLSDVLIMRPDGSGVRDLAASSDYAWSPDGTQIVAVSGPDTTQLILLAVNGSVSARVAGGTQPDWSPDGSRIACVSRSSPHVIKVTAVASGEVTLLGGTVAEPFGPAWSPDGKLIAFISLYADLYVSAIDGGAPVRLTEGSVAEGKPAWSPDGRTIAVTVETTKSGATASDIWLVPVDGSGARPLTSSGTARLPAWRPVQP